MISTFGGLVKKARRLASSPTTCRSSVWRSAYIATRNKPSQFGQTNHHRQCQGVSFAKSTRSQPIFRVIEERLRSSAHYEVFESNQDNALDWRVSSHPTATGRGSCGSLLSPLKFLRSEVLPHLLPANYPDSVAAGYSKFASFCFAASVAGSTAMVLSTQTLLLAVGVVGSQTQASVMAGALNWVLKDGIGQLGGVLFASQVSQSKLFDKSPKTWRMVAAISLDLATLLEILSPLVPPTLVLPMASIANIGKNIGYLTASASRAAIHQSMATTGNLGDVTAKAGSQSILASLVGTTLGIGISPLLVDVPHFCMGFVALSIIHQGCNFLAMKSVTLCHFDRHRLHLVLQEFVFSGTILSPNQVAEREVFLPGVQQDNSYTWLSIGSSLKDACPGGPRELETLMTEWSSSDARYIVNRPVEDSQLVHLVFHKHATAKDVIEGMLHAHLLHHHPEWKLRTGKQSHDVRAKCSVLLDELELLGWKLDDVDVEASDSVRIRFVEDDG